MHHGPVVAGPEFGGQLTGAATEQGRQLVGVVVDQSTGHDQPVRTGQVDRFTGRELPDHGGDAGRQQGGVALGDRADRTGVEHQRAPRIADVPKPEQPGRPPPPGGVEERADRFAGERRARLLSSGENDRDPCRGGDPGGIDLGDHAAGADRAAAYGEVDLEQDHHRRARR